MSYTNMDCGLYFANAWSRYILKSSLDECLTSCNVFIEHLLWACFHAKEHSCCLQWKEHEDKSRSLILLAVDVSWEAQGGPRARSPGYLACVGPLGAYRTTFIKWGQ